MSEKVLRLEDPESGSSAILPVHSPSLGMGAVDVRGLAAELGYFTYDPGYASTVSCRSAITYIDGEKGELLYRGYPIEQLAEHSSFLEVTYLLMHGELPSADQFGEFRNTIRYHTMVHENVRSFFSNFNYDAHPMSMLGATVSALSSFYHEHLDIHNARNREITAHRLIAKMPTIASYCYKHMMGQPLMYPRNELDYSENFLHLMFSLPAQEFKPSKTIIRALELILILHADHEQNASTSTVRLCGSSGTNPYAAIAAGIASLWGPAHGGANEAVINMLNELIHSEQNIDTIIARAKDPDDNFRLMGFGHRVYKNYDPRARIIRHLCNDLLDELGGDKPLFRLARQLEKRVLEDEYFIERNLYPNVDFYSGIILSAMNLPLPMFTVIFALARTVGWISHWTEMHEDPETRIGRPRQLYTGKPHRDYPVGKK